MTTWNKKECIHFAKMSAAEAVDQAAEYGAINEAIEQYCFNLQDTICEYHANDFFFDALRAYKAELEKILGQPTTARI
jgi:hypothetical protein